MKTNSHIYRVYADIRGKARYSRPCGLRKALAITDRLWRRGHRAIVVFA